MNCRMRYKKISSLVHAKVEYWILTLDITEKDKMGLNYPVDKGATEDDLEDGVAESNGLQKGGEIQNLLTPK